MLQPSAASLRSAATNEEDGEKGYRLRLLRTHGLVRKVKSQRRYHVTPKGRKIISAILAAQAATLQQLNALAA